MKTVDEKRVEGAGREKVVEADHEKHLDGVWDLPFPSVVALQSMEFQTNLQTTCLHARMMKLLEMVLP